MTKLTETQTIILSAGAQRPDNIALPLPKGLAGAAAKMAVTRMIGHGWLQEVDANLHRGEPLWRETGDGHGTTLVVTEAGLLAIGIEPAVASAVAGAQNTKPTPKPAPTLDAADTMKPVAIRVGTKQAQIIAMLQRPDGATVAEMVEATSWQAHSVRGMISGSLKKKLGLPIASEKVEGRGTVYSLAAGV
ncbi:Protein of unknown function [Paracoccus aminovorans]|uniref:DUF3489 domain-containing protein n=1 Tax=Paracoccus aminovorans TaxID=34004 RepID=A0A1I3E1G2_9RHOB|nr:DUF3489 domain-containing protein [Paracoccus aminovorans]CQR84665.1 hypothetical protein JCM7685_0072 [Paracoccus aminovorans]SFH92834.1 Protein of unknown function [Paracoccus aminovorans]